MAPPLAAITPDNQGPAVITVTYALVVVTILFAAIRIMTASALKRNFGWDDGLLVIAVLVALAQSILVGKSAVYGLGKFIAILDAASLNQYFKFSYTSELLAIFSMACAKLSVVLLMARLSAQRSSLLRLYPLANGTIGIWAVFSIFALAFQCPLPRPWIYTSGRCGGSGTLWYPVIVLNILTDLGLAFLFAPVLAKLHMRIGQRLMLIALFAIRVFVCAAAIAQLFVLAPALRATDQTRAMTAPVILQQVVLNLSILAAVTPPLHRFLNELHSSGFAGAIPTTQYELNQSSGGPHSSKGLWSKAGSSNKGGSRVTTTEKSFQEADASERHPRTKVLLDFRADLIDRGKNHTVHESTSRVETGSKINDGSEEMMIRMAKSWDVKYDDCV